MPVRYVGTRPIQQNGSHRRTFGDEILRRIGMAAGLVGVLSETIGLLSHDIRISQNSISIELHTSLEFATTVNLLDRRYFKEDPDEQGVSK